MQRLTLTLTIQDPIVISQNSATEGTHQSLDYIPGANLLGAFASKTYSSIKNSDKINAFDIFHSGKVRFGHAFPMYEQQASYPMPICLHYLKGEDKLQAYNQLHNLPNNIAGKQTKQHRKGYVTAQAMLINPTKDLHLRTAINNQTATAKSGQLFGYQSIKAGTTYQAHIDIDDQQTCDFIETEFKKIKQIRVGRSKTAHYGRIKITNIKKSTLDQPNIQTIKINHTEYLVLWLASELIAYNQQGQPTLTPSLQNLGLPLLNNNTIELDKAKSWIRTRKHSPYNSFRRSYDMEQQAIEQGSILVYPIADLTKEQLQILKEGLLLGLGCHTETGHGQVVPLDNELLELFKTGNIQLNKPKKTENKVPNKNTSLTSLLNQQHQKIRVSSAHNQSVNNAIIELAELYQNTRNYLAIDSTIPVGPSNTQWGRIRDFFNQNHQLTKSQILEQLFSSNTAIIKSTDEEWQAGTNTTNFSKFIQKQIDSREDESEICLYMRTLAREVAHSPIIKQARGG